MIAPALLGVSLFNAVLLVWLGLTVLLNAQKRTWPLGLTSGALLAGGAFFLTQATVVGRAPADVVLAMQLESPAGWLTGIALPLAWYAAMLWYADYWESPAGEARQRHRYWVPVMIVLALGIIAAVAPVTRGAHLAPGVPFFAAKGMATITVPYAAFATLCIVLALDALRHPGPSSRLMVDVARSRARPWLVAASITLLLVSLLVGAVMVGAYLEGANPARLARQGITSGALMAGDLVGSVLVAFAVLFMGQAVVAYEVFTGRSLPRRGLRQFWHGAVVLAAACGAAAAWSISGESGAAYALVLAAGLIAALYAVFNWRSYSERSKYVEQLRPFLSDSSLDGESSSRRGSVLEADVLTPFHALCGGVLEARVGFLAAVGPFASLVGPPLAYPPSAEPPQDLSDVAKQCASPEVACVPLDPSIYRGAAWAVPLWGEAGLIGLLLLGEKAGGGLYTQEDIEIARTGGERLLWALASARTAERLMQLQQQRLSASHVADRRARRVIHDEVLPSLQAAILELGAPPGDSEREALEQLASVHRRLADLLREMPAPPATQVGSRGLVAALHALMAEELPEAFEAVVWEVEPEAEMRAASLPETESEVLFHAAREAIRNAAMHGRGGDPARALRLATGVRWRDGLEITVEDDGVGIAEPGAGGAAGQGIGLHSAMMAVIGGSWQTLRVEDGGTRVILSLPEQRLAGSPNSPPAPGG